MYDQSPPKTSLYVWPVFPADQVLCRGLKRRLVLNDGLRRETRLKAPTGTKRRLVIASKLGTNQSGSVGLFSSISNEPLSQSAINELESGHSN